MLEKGYSLLRLHEWHPAEEAFRGFLMTSPQSSSGLLGLLKCLLSQGQGQEAALIVRDFPASHEYATAEILKPLAEALNKLERGTWVLQDDPLAAAFYNSIRLASRGNIFAALDGLLDIIRQNKRYNNGQPRQLVVALLELLGDHDPQTRQYRQELASILF
jgi:putative thioredoxin